MDPTQLSVQHLRPTESLILSSFLTIPIKAVNFEGVVVVSVVLIPKCQGKDLFNFLQREKE